MADHNLPEIHPDKGEWDEKALSRQGFLRFSFWTISATTFFSLSGGAGRVLVANSMQTKPAQWVTVGDLADLPPGRMHPVAFQFQSNDLWKTVEQRGVLYAYSEDGERYQVLDGTCSHLGCNVKWREEMAQFACPCHQGFYSPRGEVLSGPPPKALRQLETRIENGILKALI